MPSQQQQLLGCIDTQRRYICICVCPCPYRPTSERQTVHPHKKQCLCNKTENLLRHETRYCKDTRNYCYYLLYKHSQRSSKRKQKLKNVIGEARANRKTRSQSTVVLRSQSRENCSCVVSTSCLCRKILLLSKHRSSCFRSYDMRYICRSRLTQHYAPTGQDGLLERCPRASAEFRGTCGCGYIGVRVVDTFNYRCMIDRGQT